jgi:hypothetical protein
VARRVAGARRVHQQGSDLHKEWRGEQCGGSPCWGLGGPRGKKVYKRVRGGVGLTGHEKKKSGVGGGAGACGGVGEGVLVDSGRGRGEGGAGASGGGGDQSEKGCRGRRRRRLEL